MEVCGDCRELKEADREEAQPGKARVKYTASFDPQAWIKDHALSVDPQGDTVWDCTVYVEADPELKASIDAKHEEEGEFIDLDDELFQDPRAPGWIRNWSGPFTITVTREEV